MKKYLGAILVGICFGLATYFLIDSTNPRIGYLMSASQLPDLSDRDHGPNPDELDFLILTRKHGVLEIEIRDGFGRLHGKTLGEFEAYNNRIKSKIGVVPIYLISFDDGVTMKDIENTMEYLNTVGSYRFILGGFFYGKSLFYRDKAEPSDTSNSSPSGARG